MASLAFGRGLQLRRLWRILAVGLTAMALFAAAASARVGPHPVPCSPAPCGEPGQPPLPAGEMEESTQIHLSISPHVARPGQVVTMRVTYTGGHCRVEDGSVCGPQGTAEASMVRVDCLPPHKQLRVLSTALEDDPTQCFEVPPDSPAAAIPAFYAVITAPIGNCGETNNVEDCISADYLLLEPSCRGQCPLKVSIKTFGSGTAGLGSDNSQSPTVPEFIGPDTTGLGEGKCLSGCTNVQVTVTDKQTGGPVEGAALSASVTGFPPGGIAPYPKGFESDDGHLCRTDRPTVCGRSLNGNLPTTDSNGQVRLLYWAPGAISEHNVKITVKAEKACTTCSHRRQTGEVTHTITISSHLIFSGEAPVGHQALDTLELWAKNPGNFESILKQPVDAFAEHELSSAIQGIAEFYAKKAVPILLLADAVHKVLTTPGAYAELSTEVGQEQAFTALFADPLGLATAGLGGVDAGELDQRFLDKIAGEDGMLRRWGLASDKLRAAALAETIKLRIVEVSYCKIREQCGPGDSTPGVEPFLYFDFRADAPPSQFTPGEQIFADQFVIPYDAEFYDLLQFNGHGPP